VDERPIPPRIKDSGIIRRRKRPTDDVLIQMIEQKAGLVRPISEALGVAPRTVRGWREKSKKIASAFVEVRDGLLDLAESKLLQGIRSGNTACVIFYLKTQGKARGYIERQEVESVENVNVRAELEKEQKRLRDPKYRAALHALFAAADEADREQVKPRAVGNIVPIPPRVVE